MFIEIHIEGLDQPVLFPIDKAEKIGKEIQKRGKTFRLGKTHD